MRSRSSGPIAVGLAAVVVGLVFLHRLGQSSLPTPPHQDLATLFEWAQSTPPHLAAGCVLRLIALALGWYLLATTVAGATARILGLAAAVRALDKVTLPGVRRLLRHMVGVGLAAQLGLVPAAAAQSGAGEGGQAHTATMVVRSDTTTMEVVASGTATMGAQPSGTATMGPLPGASATMQASEAATATMEVLPSAPATMETSTDHGRARWTVRPGDHLWSIAEITVAFNGGDRNDSRAVTRYWHTLIEANRSALIDPGNPDLIVPGQTLVLPPPH